MNLTAEQALKWKSHNSYEYMNPHDTFKNNVKDILKQEINNIATDLALKRGTSSNFGTPRAKKNFGFNEVTQYNRSNSNWKVPVIESLERGFNEGARFYNPFKEQRVHGIKYVPLPNDSVSPKICQD
jgi:hypothetical protein